MQGLIPKIRKIADNIQQSERKKRELAKALKKDVSMELVCGVEPDRLESEKVVGVDGGIVKKSLHGFDCMLVRGAGACFHYRKGKIENVEYWPSKSPPSMPDVVEGMSDLDWAYYTSLVRVRTELDTALECARWFKPSVMLLDGSVVPHYADRPSKSSGVYKLYQDVIGKYKQLYHKALNERMMLAGIIEDSRNTVFCELLKKLSQARSIPGRGMLSTARDTSILSLMLETGERTRSFKYTKAPEKHPVLRDLGDCAGSIHSFYLKTAKFDRPIKVDYLVSSSCDAGGLASLILAISGHHPHYGLPAPIIEADNVAKLSEADMERFYSRILSYTGEVPGMSRLRREQRPF
jgi:hypothetical protein